MGMIIATRTLKLHTPASVVDIPISISSPFRENDGTWFCAYEIGWPEGVWKSRAGGVDSIQSLFLTLQMIGSDIYTSNYHRSGQLFLDASGNGYGFPVPISLREMLVGDDKKFL